MAKRIQPYQVSFIGGRWAVLGRGGSIEGRFKTYKAAERRWAQLVRAFRTKKYQKQANPARLLHSNWQPAMVRRLPNGQVQVKIRPGR